MDAHALSDAIELVPLQGGVIRHQDTASKFSQLLKLAAAQKPALLSGLSDTMGPPEWPRWSAPLHAVLQGSSLAELVRWKSPAEAKRLSAEDTLHDALHFMREERISGAPVFRGDAGSSHEISSWTCVGMLELGDIAAVIAKHPRGSLLDELKEQRSSFEIALDMKASSALAASGRYSREGMLKYAVDVPQVSVALDEAFARLSIFWRLRVGNTVVSQTDMMAFVHHKGIAESIRAVSVAASGAMSTSVHSVESHTPAGQVVSHLSHHQVHVVAVMKGTRIKGEFGIYDLARLDSVKQLESPVSKWASGHTYLHLPHDTTLGKVWDMFVENPGRHHIWITHGKDLSGIVTRSGVISAIMTE